MTDIVERLRGYVSESWGSALRDTREAADEIERLRAERDALRADVKRMRAALIECDHQTHSLRVWSGSQWNYHPPQAGKIAEVARAVIDAAMAVQSTDN